jgi:TusA-related sulfurtransferase
MGDEIDHFLDITSEVCPMTFVKTRLLIEKMAAGEIAEIRLSGGEPLENVPESVTELGHRILGIECESAAEDGGRKETEIHRLLIRKA